MDAPTLLDGLKHHYVAWGVVFGILTCFEVLNAREDHRLKARLLGIGFWTISLLISFAAAVMLALVWQQTGVQPLFTIPGVLAVVGGPVMGAILAALIGAVAHDFFFYWFHRIQHRWLWRWHAVHHSIERLNAVNSYHHPSEAMISLVVMQIPMSLLIGVNGSVSPIVNLVLWCHIVWIHSPTRITLGPLRALIVDNRFHRIHHSVEERHFDKNFGAFTTLWDRLFGTCHMPSRDEWPVVGIAEAGEPRGFGEWVRMPWRLGVDPARANAAALPDRETLADVQAAAPA
jgi:sterol desaturase/sphingolipid hydroxylase (fatty acid hydroxylase superfamily)